MREFLPCGDEVPSLEEDVNDVQAPFNPLPLTDENIRAASFQIAQGITTQAQSATTQAQTMMTVS